MKKIYVLTGDFIFKAKINTILNSLNLSAEIYNYFQELKLNLNDESQSLFIIDLENENLDFSYLKDLKKTQADKLFLLGYCSHVKNDLMENALKSGFDKVNPRSKFVKILPDFLNNFDKLDK